ncbi:hypothetical protein PLANPX_4585 [Lacipirellula parvula]|uniref:Uncharacterized protein n=1 Tax=Lacipirellula parvula TaxID=2650471 RepID=A0A5K7XKT2_9BACT|nr:hypothetical protein PLANPX_4585 [Lacipirellula parvula]
MPAARQPTFSPVGQSPQGVATTYISDSRDAALTLPPLLRHNA